MSFLGDKNHIFCFSGGNTTQSGKKQTSTIILTPPPGVATNLFGVTCESCYGKNMALIDLISLLNTE